MTEAFIDVSEHSLYGDNVEEMDAMLGEWQDPRGALIAQVAQKQPVKRTFGMHVSRVRRVTATRWSCPLNP